MYAYVCNNNKEKGYQLEKGRGMGQIKGRVAGKDWREEREEECDVILFQLKTLKIKSHNV